MARAAKTASPSLFDTPAILLAGGRASRMGGGDKCLRLLTGKPLLWHVIERLRPQLRDMVINANGDPARFWEFGLPVVPDGIAGQPGPLAGILAGLDWAARERPVAACVLSVSTDCPFLPPDLLARLADEIGGGADIATAASNGRLHPVIGLWRVSIREDLRQALVQEGLRRVETFCERHRSAVANFPGNLNLPGGAVDPFFNANTLADLALAERLVKAASGG
jgi:molybdopterin-guanine dinucleotide biosynthesis protein A